MTKETLLQKPLRYFLWVTCCISYHYSNSTSYSQDRLIIQGHTLTIKVKGVREVKGNMVIAVYNSAESFMYEAQMLRYKVLSVNSRDNTVSMVLPTGEYAVSLFQDKNADKKLNTNLFGFPREPYGFSNDAQGTFGLPDFSEASFALAEDKMIVINLWH